MNVGEAFVTVRPDTKGFANEAKRGIGGGLKTAGFAAAAGFAAVGFAAKGFVEAALESNKVAAQTEAVVKSTGGAAKVSAKQISALADSISRKTGVDDEAIQSGENLLLTFTKVRNEAGKGNDIFNQATETITDMSAALGQDTKASAIQLGKALNDPIRGVTALQRVGVSFTASQKKQIETLVKTGDTLGAQKLILAELNKEFGGSAAAIGTPLDKLKVQLGNVAEQIGNVLLPYLLKLADFISRNLPGAIAFVTRVFNKLRAVLAPITAVIQNVTGAIGDAGLRSSEAAQALGGDGPKSLVSVLKSLGGKIAKTVGEWGKAFVEWIAPRIAPMLQELGHLLGRLGAWMLDVGLPALFEKLKAWGSAFVKWIAPIIGPLLLELLDLLGRLNAWIVTTALPKIVTALAKWGWAFVKWVAVAIPRLLIELVKLADRVAAWIVDEGLPKLKQNLPLWGAAFLSWVADVVKKLPRQLLDIQTEIIDFIKTLPRKIQDAADGMFKGIVDEAKKLPGQIQKAATSGLGKAGATAVNAALNPASLFTGRASGGPVVGGQSYVVGERGPELFTPGRSGGITSNKDLGGVTYSTTIHSAAIALTPAELLATLKAARFLYG